ncbi:MAG TPA: penicillin-binding transpeptidase domain-containing protein [Polyangiaceae bacterium]
MPSTEMSRPFTGKSLLAIACLALVSLAACGAGAPPPATPQASAAAPSANSALAGAQGASEPKELKLSADYFGAERVHGGIAIYDTQNAELACTNRSLCNEQRLPASTFKIVNSIIALETGVIDDAETKLPWDGKQYSVPEWNQDNTLRSAVRVSCVPCFQAIARKIGTARLRDWVTRLDYGNHDIAGTPDRFWLDGALRVTPLEQIDFLRRLDGGKLPISPRTLEIVRDVLTLDVGPDFVLRGKTGSVMPPQDPMEAGWFVGWVERGDRRVFFATLIDSHEAGVDVLPVRRLITERVLRELQVLPAP